MLPQQRGMLSSWFSSPSDGKRRRSVGKSLRRKRGYSRQTCVESLEQRLALTNTLYIDFGDNMNATTMQENTTPTTAGWNTFGYLAPDTPTGSPGTSWLLGPQFTYAGNPNITYTPLQTVFSDKGMVFNIGQQPSNDPFQFQTGPQAQVSQYALFESSITQMLTRMFAPFNIQVVALRGPSGASGFGAPSRNGTTVASILARNNPLFEPNTFDPANPPADPTSLRGRDFDPASVTGTGYQYQDAYILVGGWTRAGVQVGDDGQLGIFGAGNLDLLLPDGSPLTFDDPDPLLNPPLKYSDGGGAVAADEIFDKALANGYNGTTKVQSIVNPNVAIADVAAQIAAQSWGLIHSSDGEAKPFNPFFDTDIDMLSGSDVMRQGPGPNAGATSFPTTFDMPFFQRYSMMDGDLNQNVTNVDPTQLGTGATSAYDALVNDPDIGPNTGAQYNLVNNPFNGTGAEYVSGTGAFDVINITAGAPGFANVSISPFRDDTYSAASFISSWSETQGAFTTFATPETYTIDLSSGVVLIEAGLNTDLIRIDPTLSGVQFIVFGGASIDNLVLDDSASGAESIRVDPSNINSTGFNFDTRFDTTLTISSGSIIQAFEFDNDSALHLDGFSSLRFEIPAFLGSNITLSNQAGSVIPTVVTPGQETTIDGTAGPTALSNLVGFANVEFTRIATVSVEDLVGVVSDIVTVDGSGGTFAAGLKNLNINLGPGSDTLIIAATDVNMPVGGGAFTYNGGTSNDTIATDADTDFTLQNGLLTVGPGGSGGTVVLNSVETADIAGGFSNNILTILTWSGAATVSGSFGADTINLGDAANTVTGNITAHGNDGNDTFNVKNLSGIAMLFGDAGNDSFFFGLAGEIDGITGQTTVFAGSGTDTMTLDDSGNATVQDYTIGATTVSDTSTFGGVTFDSNLENIVLTGSQGDNTFNVTPNLRTIMTINGSNPIVPTGDSLLLDFTGTKGRKLVITGAGTGFWSFTSGQKNVNFTSIETLDDFNPLLGAPLLAGAGDTGKSSKPLVKIYQVDNNNAVVASFYAYEQTYKGGVRVQMADVNNDGVLDVITAPGAGRVGQVKVFDGKVLGSLADASPTHFVSNPAPALLVAFNPEGAAYKSGLFFAVGDLDGDGFADIVTSRSTGKPSVRALMNNGSGTAFASLGTFAPYTVKEKVTTGAVVGVADVDGDGFADIVTAPGAGSVVTIKVFNGQTFQLEHQFLGFESTFKNSVSLTLGDADGDGVSEIMLGAGAGGNSRVRVFDTFGTLRKQFQAYTSGNIKAPLRIVARNVNGNVVLFTAQSNDGRSRTIQGFNPLTGALVDAFLDTDVAFNPGEWLG